MVRLGRLAAGPHSRLVSEPLPALDFSFSRSSNGCMRPSPSIHGTRSRGPTGGIRPGRSPSAPLSRCLSATLIASLLPPRPARPSPVFWCALAFPLTDPACVPSDTAWVLRMVRASPSGTWATSTGASHTSQAQAFPKADNNSGMSSLPPPPSSPRHPPRSRAVYASRTVRAVRTARPTAALVSRRVQ